MAGGGSRSLTPSHRRRILLVWALAAALLLTACPVAVEEKGPTPTPTAQVVRPTPGAVERGTPTSTGVEPSCYQPTPSEPAVEGTPQPPSERLRSPGPVATPSAFEPLPFATNAALEARIREVLGDQIDSYAVAVKNLADGSGAAVNADKTFYAASLFKVTVMFEVFHQRSLGPDGRSLLSFDERLLVTPYYAGFDLGTLPVEVCQTLSIGEALGYMMSISDNTSAVLLQDRVGAGNINRSLEALGLATTRLLADDLPTTAADMALLLEAIARGRAVDEAASQEMVNLLASEEIDNGLKAGVLAAESAAGVSGTVVAHKTGNWSDATHDAGIVYSPGATYVIVILSDKAYETKLTQDVSRVVWEWYNKIGSANDEG